MELPVKLIDFDLNYDGRTYQENYLFDRNNIAANFHSKVCKQYNSFQRLLEFV